MTSDCDLPKKSFKVRHYIGEENEALFLGLSHKQAKKVRVCLILIKLIGTIQIGKIMKITG